MDRPTESVTEPGCKFHSGTEFDVVVAGGGIGGVRAAARNGASVCILEKAFSLGGLATLSNHHALASDLQRTGSQVIARLAEKLLRLSVADLDQDHLSFTQ